MAGYEMEKLTFKQYLEENKKLREAVTNVPVQSVTYVVNKYCKIPVGDSKEDKEFVALKPKHKVVVEWRYDSIDNPHALKIMFEGVKEVNEDDDFKSFWSDEKLQKWLIRNTREEV